MEVKFKEQDFVKVWNFIGNYWVYCTVISTKTHLDPLYKLYSHTHKDFSYCEPWYLQKTTALESILYGSKT